MQRFIPFNNDKAHLHRSPYDVSVADETMLYSGELPLFKLPPAKASAPIREILHPLWRAFLSRIPLSSPPRGAEEGPPRATCQVGATPKQTPGKSVEP
ncbi:hypothetical protein CEXT_288351 [Caerostris extrusa]|uniref:Uncharacterized protein n=1 Tax=Caerostris extrusa TaxID=172846 RepID=A0AAV4MN25_CAEEX|nr:hypothetical protein CEXT_288351 [Caerostris extrusa]